MRGIVIHNCRHTHSERRCEEGNESLAKQRTAYLADTLLEARARKGACEAAHAGTILEWRDISKGMAHEEACNGWLFFELNTISLLQRAL